MADPAKFGHDRLGHLLSDTLLTVPKFQRHYSWQEEHVTEYWADVTGAMKAGSPYFMGSVVLASSDGDDRKLIVDGQQRITTTALLLAAARDRLVQLGQVRAAQSVESEHLSDYVLAQEQTVAKLILSPDDVPTYNAILDSTLEPGDKTNVAVAYRLLKTYVDLMAPEADTYKSLIELVTYVDKEVQVLLAVASGIPEAYVIFETLNDRGADLTTADLLKNYLFSRSGAGAISHAEAVWTRISAQFDKPDDFVKFLRHEYMSRAGRVTNRKLYKAIQADIGNSPKAVAAYLNRLESTLSRYIALREPDDPSWSSQSIEVKDSILAFRRFGFESSMPLLLAAFAKWSHSDATRFVDVVAAWSVRAWFNGTLGGGVAENAFCDAAVDVTEGRASTSQQLLGHFDDLVPDDNAFRQAVTSYGAMTTTRAKYLLARLERQHLVNDGQLVDAMPDWSSKSVTIEHLLAKSMKRADFRSTDDYDHFLILRDQLGNFALLERTLNNDLENRAFDQKTSAYKLSVFALTRILADPVPPQWSFEQAADRARMLADLAVSAWPR